MLEGRGIEFERERRKNKDEGGKKDAQEKKEKRRGKWGEKESGGRPIYRGILFPLLVRLIPLLLSLPPSLSLSLSLFFPQQRCVIRREPPLKERVNTC